MFSTPRYSIKGARACGPQQREYRDRLEIFDAFGMAAMLRLTEPRSEIRVRR